MLLAGFQPKPDRKLWGIRVRKALIVALIAPFFTVISAVAPQVSQAALISAVDGSCTQDVGSTSGVTVTKVGNDCVVVFTNTTSTTWKAPTGVTNVRYLVVGGGASGDRGRCGPHWGHGGGGGQVRDATLAVSAGTNYTVAVGAGGAASGEGCPDRNGNDGAQSQFASITSSGGYAAAANSAVGGTSGAPFLGGTGTGASPAGGGGGAGGSGNNINGGVGVNSNISGTEYMYGSGGAGRNGSGFGTAS